MVAQRCAVTIVNELPLQVEDKTVKPVSTRNADGRAEVGGRGRGGQTQRFEASNIRFEVATDDHGIFNGSDEHASKAAGHARNGAREYLRFALEHQGLFVPLTCTVDYHGFRVLCSAKLPLIQRTFGELGEVRREKEELVHGTCDRGETVLNSNRALDHILASIAQKLNLSKHAAKGDFSLFLERFKALET